MMAPSFNITATERVLPRISLDFTNAVLDPRISFLRSGNTATVTNSSGLVESVNADIPRFDYDPLTLACKGLLIESSSVNTLLGSGNISGTLPWVVLRATISGTYVTAPDGTNTGAKIVEDTTASATHYLGQDVTWVSGTTYTISIYAKKSDNDRPGVGIWLPSFPGNVRAFFNLDTLTVGYKEAAALNPTIIDVGNGWRRCSMTVVAPANQTSRIQFMPVSNTAVVGGATYTGNGTSGVYVWGAQREIGYLTSYIPTGASQVTRTSDVATMTGTNFSDWYSAGAGGVVARVLPSTVFGTRPALQFDDATADEVITLRGDTTNPELVIVDGGSPQAQIDAGTISANTAYNLCAAWNTDNCAAAVNGGAAVTDTSATIPTVTQARLGSDGTNYLNGHLQNVRYWPQRIINAEVQAFSK